MHEIPLIAHERDVSSSRWLRLDEHVTYAARRPYAEKMDKVLKTQLTDADSLRAARLRALLLRLELLQGYITPLTGTETSEQYADLLAAPAKTDRSFMRQWVYDTGAGACTIGRKFLSESELKSIETFTPAMRFSTANGPTYCTEAVWCKVPHLGPRKCYVVDECPPLISVGQDVYDYGNVFYWDQAGPVIETPKGEIIRLDMSYFDRCPYLPVDACAAQKIGAAENAAEADVNRQSGLPATTVRASDASTKAAGPSSGDESKRSNRDDRSSSLKSAKHTAKNPSVSTGAKERRSAKSEVESALHNTVEIQRPGGDTHNMEAKCYSMKTSSAYVKDFPGSLIRSGSVDEDQPFFVEVFSGSGRLSAAVRRHGIKVYEIDITQQGGRQDVHKKDIFAKLLAWINHPLCLGMWFGFPCGTFSAARRHDGGPPPLRGHGPKDIWGLPEVTGINLQRVRSANKLLRRMDELMKACAKAGLPFYLENPLRSKIWITPQILKWIRAKGTTLTQFDYCQFGQEWMKPTQILSFNNRNFCATLGKQCKPTWVDGKSICSRTGKPHVALKGKEASGKYKTATACPYPQELAKHWSNVLVKPRRDRRINSTDDPRNPGGGPPNFGKQEMLEGGITINPAITIAPPDAEHYLTHLPKHPGCAACNNCKVQRKQRRDQDKAARRKWKAEHSTNDFPELVEPYVPAEKVGAPKKFGDSVTSDSIIVVKQ